jgi:hypothetical protein
MTQRRRFPRRWIIVIVIVVLALAVVLSVPPW